MKALLTFCLLIVACGSTEKIPDDLIEKKEFVQILYEIELVDAMAIQNPKTHKDSITLGNYKFLFDSLDITKDRFDRSFEYYRLNNEEMLEITDSLIAKIGREEEAISKALRDQRWKSRE